MSTMTVTYEGLRSGLRRTVRFELGSDEANKYAAVKLAWDCHSRIVAFESGNEP